jgi:hypothetical protein
MDELLAQEQAFGAAQVTAVEDTEQKKAQIRAQYRQQETQAVAAFAGSMGDIFGGMAGLMEKEGKDGMEKNKSMLKAQAWMQAISASVGIFNNVANTPGMGPFAYAAAGAAMAATMVSLSAQIKKIDNPGSGSSSSGASITGGHYTALNASSAASRATQFQKGEDRRNTASSQGAAASASKTETILSNIEEGIRTQKVVLDQSTIADVNREGKATNERRIQTSN